MMFSGKFMKKILLDSKAKVNNESKRKIHLYSGHDVNIVSVLNFFGIMFPHIPSYGSCIVLEIHEDNNKSYLKVS